MQQKRLIIRCPDCESNGIKQSLAEVLPTGFISIQRIRTGLKSGGHKDHTIIFSSDMKIFCGNCGNIVYQRSGS